MRERVEERHERILRVVRERGTVRVSELSAELGVSLETTRRDVLALAEVGRLKRVHGKVYWPTVALGARDARQERKEWVGSRDRVIGLVVPVAGYFFEEIIRGARAAAAAAGARLLVGVTEYRTDRDAAQIEGMLRSGVDGLLLAPSGTEQGLSSVDWAQIEGLEVPVVLLERAVGAGERGAQFDRVCTDHAEGAATAVRHLAGLGHERIALLTRATHHAASIRRGYRTAMNALGLPSDDLCRTEIEAIPSFLGADPSPLGLGYFETFDEEVDQLLALARSGEVRAALVHTDTDSLNLLQRLSAQGVGVPGDFALVSYDDELAALASVPLTAVAPPKHAIGEHAVGLLLRRFADPHTDITHVDLLPRLTVRASCGAVAQADQ